MNTIHLGVEAPRGLAPNRALRLRLLRRRDELAAAASEHTGHDLPGADLLWQAVHEVEELLRELFPATWERRNADWVAADAARLHVGDRLRPQDCRICACTEQVQAPPQAS